MLSVIIVNYNSREYLQSCLASIYSKMRDFPVEVLVINNDAQPLDPSVFKPNLKILEINNNVGFGTACNAGAAMSTGEIFLFLNPDTQIISENFSDLLKKFDSDKKIGAIGPKIISSEKTIQEWSFGEEVTILNLIKNHIFPKKDFPKKDFFETNWISGAAFFIRKDLFKQLRGFDEDFFMYFEDVDLCKRIRQQSFKVCCFHNSEIMHSSGGSFKKTKIQKSLYRKSQDIYFLKHLGKLSFFLLKIFQKLY